MAGNTNGTALCLRRTDWNRWHLPKSSQRLGILQKKQTLYAGQMVSQCGGLVGLFDFERWKLSLAICDEKTGRMSATISINLRTATFSDLTESSITLITCRVYFLWLLR